MFDISLLTDKDDNIAYAKTKEIVAESEKSDEYYKYLNDFASMLDNEKSYVRTRAFILICSQARWDNDGKIKEILPYMTKLFGDDKPTIVRQCLNAVKEIAVYRPELHEAIKNEIKKIDISVYKESMSLLIKKDIDSVLDLIAEMYSMG